MKSRDFDRGYRAGVKATVHALDALRETISNWKVPPLAYTEDDSREDDRKVPVPRLHKRTKT